MQSEELAARMHWTGGLPHTVCGNGSRPEHTANIRRALPLWLAKYGIASVADAGAGDLQWLAGMSLPADYRPYDLVPRAEGVMRWDITAKTLPKADLILCRMVLNHLSDALIAKALTRFRKSATYLAATQFDGGGPQRSAQFRRLDLVPMLGRPIEAVQDGSENNCRLALWRL